MSEYRRPELAALGLRGGGQGRSVERKEREGGRRKKRNREKGGKKEKWGEKNEIKGHEEAKKENGKRTRGKSGETKRLKREEKREKRKRE